MGAESVGRKSRVGCRGGGALVVGGACRGGGGALVEGGCARRSVGAFVEGGWVRSSERGGTCRRDTGII